MRGGPAGNWLGICGHCVSYVQTSSPASEVGGSVVCSGLRGTQGLKEEHLVARFLACRPWALAWPLPLPALGSSHGLQAQDQHQPEGQSRGVSRRRAFT